MLLDNLRFGYYLSLTNIPATLTGFRKGLGVFDFGLRFMHTGSIIVRFNAKVGNNCFIYRQTLIGQTQEGKAALIDDNDCICSGSKIIGPRHN
jgi:serine acetyltransferase